MFAIEFEMGKMGCQGDKINETRNFFPEKPDYKEYVSASSEGVSSEINDRQKDPGIDRTTIYTNDCLRDYYFLKKEEMRFLSEPSYTMDGLIAEFVDHGGNTYVLVEKRNYSED